MKKILSAILILLFSVFSNAYGEMTVKHGSTSQLINIFISDSSSTSGAGKTGLLYTSTNLTAYYYCSGATPVSVTLATMTVGTWASGGFIQIDATNMPGWYQFGVPNNALVSGCGNEVSFNIFEKTTTALNVVPLPFAISLVSNLESDTYAKVDTEVDAIKTKTDQFVFTVANQVDANALTGGGTGLTAQQTRDAMKLAPTAGDPAAGSLDALIRRIRR